MKKLLLTALSLCVGVGGWASSAMALNFTLDSYDVFVHDSDPGLVLWERASLPTPASWDLEVGNSVTFDLFYVGTNEEYVNWDDLWRSNARVEFVFSAPESSTGYITGESRGQFGWWVRDDRGVVEWDGPSIFDFGNGGSFSVTLSDATFGTPGYDTVQARLTYHTAPTASVPEPATMLLFGAGLTGLAGLARRRK